MREFDVNEMHVPAPETFVRPEWLNEFERLKGRPLRILHIGNIANNAYSNAKIMREIGIEADVVCADYYHMMGTPEWEEATIKGDIGDPYFPDWWRVAKGYRRPSWFFQGPRRLCQLALRSQFEADIDEREARHNMELATHYISYRDSMLRSNSGFMRRLGRRYAFANFILRIFARRPGFVGSSLAELYPPIVYLFNVLRLIGMSVVLPFLFLFTLIERLGNLLGSGTAKFGWRFTFLFLRVKWQLQTLLWQRLIRPALPIASRVFRTITGKNFSEVTGRSAAEMFGGAPVPKRRELEGGFAHQEIEYGDIINAHEKQRYMHALKDYFARMGDYSKWSNAHRRWHRNTPEDALAGDAWLGNALTEGWHDVFRHYDIIQAYSTDGIIPMAAGETAYFCFEHGTLRSIPFEDNQIGRLTATAYRACAGMIVTNLDTLDRLAKLRIPRNRAIFLPAPLDDRRYHRFIEQHRSLMPKPGSPVIFFSAARQHWLDRDPNYAKGNDIFLRAFAQVVRPEDDAIIKMVAWGRDLDATKELLLELGIADRVVWMEPMKIDALWKEYLKAHVVFDQFIIPAFGRVTFDALLFGRRVISNLDKAKARTFFSRTPPMMVADDVASAAAAIRKVLNDPDDDAGIGLASRKWAMDYHSSQRILDLQLEAYRPVAMQADQAGNFS